MDLRQKLSKYTFYKSTHMVIVKDNIIFVLPYSPVIFMKSIINYSQSHTSDKSFHLELRSHLRQLFFLFR